MEEGLTTALRLESLLILEKRQRSQEINMADHVDLEKSTAEVNTVGADTNPPTWAKRYFEQQTRLMEKLVETIHRQQECESDPGDTWNVSTVEKWAITSGTADATVTKITIRETPTWRDYDACNPALILPHYLIDYHKTKSDANAPVLLDELHAFA